MNPSKTCFRFPRRRSARFESGQALVELALVLPFFMVPLFIGAAEFSRAAYAYIEVSNAARAAVQYGAQDTATAGDTDGMLTAAKADYTLNANSLTLTQASLACNCSDSGASVSCSDASVCSGAHIEKTLTVQLQAVFDPGFYEPFMSNMFTVRSIAVQKVLQ
jgi:Flp pilus assembly protein TadG